MEKAGDDREFRRTLEKRYGILAALHTQPQSKPELVDSIGPSRSTIDRGIRELEDLNCIQRIDSRYHLTSLGELSYNEYQKYANVMGDIYRASTILDALPDDSIIESEFLHGANIHMADPSLPESALQPSIDQLEITDRMVGLAPVALSLYTGLIEDFVNENGLQTEIIIRQSTLDSLIEFYQDSLEQMTRNENLTFCVTQEDLPYALWIMEQGESAISGITVYENGGVQGVIMNDTAEAISWAHTEYQRYRSNATQVPLDAKL